MSTKFYSNISLDEVSTYILNSLNAHIAIVDEKGIIKAFNHHWKEASENLEEKWYRPDLDQNILKALQEPLTRGDDYALRLLLGLKAILQDKKQKTELNYPLQLNGEKKWFKVTVNKLQGTGGAVLVHEDITTLVKSRQAQKEYELKYKKHFENNLYGILLVDDNNRILEANSAACKMLGLSPEEIILQMAGNYLPLNMDVYDIQKTINKQGNFLGESKIRTAEGKEIPVELNVILYRNEEGISITSWSFKNLSQKKKVEEELLHEKQFIEHAISALPTNFFVIDETGKMVRWNERMEKDLGYSRNEIEKFNAYDLIIEDDWEETTVALKKALEGNDVHLELRCLSKDGELIHYIVSGQGFTQNGKKYVVGGAVNVNELKNAEFELERTKTFNELAVKGTNLGLWEINLNTGSAFYNDKWYQMLGYNKEDIEFSRDFFYSLIHPDDAHKPEQELERYKSGEKDQYRTEFRLRASDGTYRWILATARSMEWDANNNPVSLAGSHLDITDQKEREKELQRINERLEQSQKIANLGYWTHDIPNDKSEWSQEVYNIWEQNPDNFTPSFESLLKTIHPDDVDPFLQKPENAFPGNGYHDSEHRIITPSGEVKWISERIKLHRDKSGNPLFMEGIARDITKEKKTEIEKRRSQERFSQLFDNSPIGIVQVDTNGKVMEINNSFESMFGYAQDEIKNRNLNDLIIPEIKQKEAENFSHYSFMGDTFQTEAVRLRKDGSEIPVLVGGIPVKVDDEVIAIYGMYVDIRERKKLENQILELLEAEKRTRKVVESSLKEKETLLQEVHHRVKNNLAIVSGLLELEMMGCNEPALNSRLSATQSRIITIAKVHELLYKNESLTHIHFNKFIESVANISGPGPHEISKNLFTEFHLDEVELNVNQAIPAGILLTELLAKFNHLNLECEQKANGDPETYHVRLSLINNRDCVGVEIFDTDKKLIHILEENIKSTKSLSNELIDVLLAQIHGEMVFSYEEEHELLIHFPKREAKGPHNALV